MWITRDLHETLTLWIEKPERSLTYWYSSSRSFRLDKKLFPEMTWETEPREVDLY
jgi:hypothetical protein